MKTAEEILKQQQDYYNARASEYDQWWEREGRFVDDSKEQWEKDKETLLGNVTF